jgi:hypothetical protein
MFVTCLLIPAAGLQLGHVEEWDISFMFAEFPFDQPIGNWDVSSVLNMGHVFTWVHRLLIQPLGNWDVERMPMQDRSLSTAGARLQTIPPDLAFTSIRVYAVLPIACGRR